MKIISRKINIPKLVSESSTSKPDTENHNNFN